MPRRFVLSTFAALHLVACAAAGEGPPPGTGEHDVQVPAGEPRATVRLVVDLPARSDCEEAFDLALYAHRGVDFVTWDAAGASCHRRAMTVRYLPRRIGRAALLERVRVLTTRMEVVDR